MDVGLVEANPEELDPVLVRKAAVEPVLEDVLLMNSDVLVVVLLRDATGVEDSENDLVIELEFPFPCASDVEVVVVVVV